MWTPRRVLLLLGGILLFGGVYGFYSRVLGWMDGLPPLPAKMLDRTAGTVAPPIRPTSPTIERIREAFGPDCLEQHASHYPTQLEFRNGESSTVLACGAPPFNGTNRIALTPFSVATFGAPKLAHLRQPGEAPEINTFHADKAILEFDRPVNGPADMGKSKLIRMELISEPDPIKLRLDRRCGIIHITNNQRSADPSKFLVIRTVGPLFYRDPKSIDAKSPPGSYTGPDIWTDAALEIIDRQNLPRSSSEATANRYRTYSIPEQAETAPVKGPDLQSSGPVVEILTGRRLPPPTVTAIGMKIFLDPPNTPDGKPSPKKSNGTMSGVKRVELLEKVLVHLWTESKQSLISSPEKPGPAAANPPPASPRLELPQATAALTGAAFHGVELIRRLDRTLLQVDTLGRLTYEADKNTARFDVLPDGNQDLPNDVQVHRVPPLGSGMQRLFSQFLELEFNGPPVGAEANKPAPKASANSGGSFKRLRAWAEMPGRIITLSSEPDRLEAYGQYLLYDRETETTTLRGLPLTTVRTNEPRPDGKPAGSNVLTAGSKERPAILTLKPGPGPERSTTASVEGHGRIELYDQAAQANTIQANWQTRMVATKEIVNKRELDLFTFVDEAMFEDKRAEFWLKGKELRLWLSPRDDAGGSGSSRSLPQRVQALGEVSSRSADLEIEQAESLNVLFRDGVPPLVAALEPKGPVAVAPIAGPMPMGPPMPMKPVEPQKPKPPMKIKARTIDTWMVRYPVPVDPKAAVKAEGGSLKYELDKARCEGAVEVHQEPAEPAPDKRGLDIRGQTLLVDSTPDGSVMTVTGTDEATPGQVHNDGMSIIGAKIVIDQLHNTADVEGRGSLVLPSNTGLGGGDLKKAAVVVVHWRDSMKFKGADRWSEFLGKVTAQQNDSYVACHIMQVRFDRPIDFSRRGKIAPPPVKGPSPPTIAGKPPEKESPKIESVRCYPAPEDLRDEPKDAYWVSYHDVTRDDTGRIVKEQHLVARELEMTARAIEPGNPSPYQRVLAAGPGTMRLWQTGLKDETAPMGKAPVATPAKEPETKLTIVHFAGRMTARDFGSTYQDATFQDTIELLYAPADRLDAVVDRHRLPVGAVRLTCSERLIVSSHKQPGVPTTQRLDAIGNADIRSDTYDGWGETITSDGPTVTLKGGENTLARIKNRFNMNSHNGKKIVYNRLTGEFDTSGSAGSTIQPGGK